MLIFIAGLALLSVVAATPTDTAVTQDFLDGRLSVQLPAGYDRHESSNRDGMLFVRRGDWAAALAKALPNKEYDDLFLEDWFDGDIRDYVVINVIALTDREDVEATPREIHERFARGFTGRWGKYSFSFFDDETGIGRCVNYAGAFVFVATRKLDDALIVIEAMDNVEALVAEESPLPEGTEPVPHEILWAHFRRAANDDTVAEILNSARITE